MHGMPHNQLRKRLAQRAAFTLVEILIVVTIIGILAMIVIPQFTNASKQASENSLKDDLRYLRTQIAVYRAHHRDVSPGVSGDFTQQLTMFSDEAGNVNATASTVYKFGPYLSKVPQNPLNLLDTIKATSDSDLTTDVDDTTGWIYNPATQQIIANSSGSDNNGSGTPYSHY